MVTVTVTVTVAVAVTVMAAAGAGVGCAGRGGSQTAKGHPLINKHDVEYSATHVLHISHREPDEPDGRDARGGGAAAQPVRVIHRARIEVVPLGSWTRRRSWFSVTEQWHSPIRSIRAYQGRRPVPRAHILDLKPEMKGIFLHRARLRRVWAPVRRLGEPLVVHWEKEHRDVRFLPLLRVPNVDYVKRFRVEVHHPADLRVVPRWWHRTGRAAPTVIRRGEGPTRVTRVELRKLDEIAPRAWDPFDGERAVLWLTLEGPAGPLHPVSGEDFTRWIRGLFDTRGRLSPETRALVRRLTAKARGARGRAEALYDFVREQVRYIADERGLGAIAPRPPETVLARRWGDCKDKANLLIAMGRFLGLRLDPVLVATDPRPTMTGAWHPGMFNHAIAVLRLADGERVFLDPTAPHIPFGHLPAGDLDKLALVLDPARPKPQRLPSGHPGRPASLTAVVSPFAEEPTQGRAHFVVRNVLLHAVQGLRQRRGDGVPWQRRLARALSGLLSALELRNLRLVREQPASLTLSADVELRRLLIKAGPEVFVRRTPRPPCPPRVETRREDHGPLLLPPPFGLDLRIRFPNRRYSLRPATRQRVAARGVAWLDSWAARRDDIIELGLQVGRRRRYLSKQQKREYLRFCEQAGAAADGWFVLRQRGGTP
jgi:transglutaminase-like putative cysteine protease